MRLTSNYDQSKQTGKGMKKLGIVLSAALVLIIAIFACQRAKDDAQSAAQQTLQAITDSQIVQLQTWQGELDSLAGLLQQRELALEQRFAELQIREAEIANKADSLAQAADSVHKMRTFGIVSLLIGVGLTLFGLALVIRNRAGKSTKIAPKPPVAEQTSAAFLHSNKKEQAVQGKPAPTSRESKPDDKTKKPTPKRRRSTTQRKRTTPKPPTAQSTT